MSPIVAASRVAARAGVRNFQTSSRLANTAATVLPASKPVGSIRSGMTGFLLGSALAGTAAYSFLTKEFKTQNDLLLEDLYALQASVQRVGNHLQALEGKVDALEKKKK